MLLLTLTYLKNLVSDPPKTQIKEEAEALQVCREQDLVVELNTAGRRKPVGGILSRTFHSYSSTRAGLESMSGL